MVDINDLLARIAAALERLAPPPHTQPDWLAYPGYVLHLQGIRPISQLHAPDLSLLQGIQTQKEIVVANVTRLAAGHSAHDMLLWGARGMGKSALLRAAVIAAQQEGLERIALLQVSSDALSLLTDLFKQLSAIPRRFLIFIDDLGFDEGDSDGPRHLRSSLEGGVDARPDNVRLAITANRRAIVSRRISEQDDPLIPRDAVDDQLALADRFGLSIGFHVCSQEDYLAIIKGYAQEFDLPFSPTEALEWARQRGARSGRMAWHYVTELAGRAERLILQEKN